MQNKYRLRANQYDRETEDEKYVRIESIILQ